MENQEVRPQLSIVDFAAMMNKLTESGLKPVLVVETWFARAAISPIRIFVAVADL